MNNFDALPLFPLDVVLYPEMPLPLHIFEPRYLEMVAHCRRHNTPFGVVLTPDQTLSDTQTLVSQVGTTARIQQVEETDDGRLNIVVAGETRFRIAQISSTESYTTARVDPFWEHMTDPILLKAPFDMVTGLFRTYLKSLFALTHRTLSSLQLPLEPENLSYAIASVLQIPLSEKQKLLELTTTEGRLSAEIEILRRELDAQVCLQEIQSQRPECGPSVIEPVSVRDLNKLSSRN
ncbi:ATP-dependent protease [Capsulimonas corticalis]|uniref:ATP-dependent protease n=1 Tax=Capsulimonas corticalis TaxID=2219043 RepID=A0A402D6S8_9BACT|nr:LON peptidase substrate-binding domain-containing protein [Capsulimonas corticalis]BDI31791.1 ATP-dependent protease [Capsulimonas corticalis]